MGEHEELISGLLLNGLLPSDSSSGIRVLDGERWAEAEKRTAELIACIQPNQPSEDRRGAVADYVQRLIMRCFPCQVVTFGSVPLKTYLPDGDIDVTAFSKNQNLKDTWAVQVRDLLESEEKNENAEFCVKEVQYIQAEVKIIKCLVENIVVDISFNQLGGLCTLCFLEEVDNLINQDHLFKRSIILIKAWCYYESRILGAHHGLISTYALETLVLYIFHIFNNSFTGPLEVLYRFLEFFRNFDWENFCVSLWGPVPVNSLPDINAEPPRKDGGELLLSKVFLQACNSVYAVFPEGLENQGQPFISKHLNVIDPLRINNNLGRSVSKGNYYRIRSAFAYGAKRLSRVLDCPKENIAAELNRFFMNTWERHDSGIRPDAPVSDLACVRLSDPDNHSNSSYNKESIDDAPTRVTGIEAVQSTWPLSSQSLSHSRESIPNCNDAPTGFSPLVQKINVKPSSLRMLDQPEQLNPTLRIQSDRSKRTLKHDEISNQLQGKHLFTRTRSSPELTDAYRDSSSRSRRIKPAEKRDIPVDSASVSNSHIDDLGSVTVIEDRAAVIRAQELHQQEQDLVNMMASSSLHDFSGHIPMPLNLGSSHLPLPISQTVIGSMGMLPANTPLVDPHWASSVQFQQALMSYHFSQCFREVGLSTNSEDIVLNGGFGPEDETLEVSRGDDGQPSTSGNSSFVSSSRMASSGSSLKAHRRERPTSVQNDYTEPFPTRDNRVIETYSDERISGGKTSSESSWDGSSTRVSKAAPDKRGRKAVTSDPVSSKIQVKGKSILEQASTEVDDGYRDCITLPTTGNKIDDNIPASQRGTDNSGTGRFTFYPTGPPVPFFTMLPVYNYPGEGEGSEPSGTPLGGEGGFCNSDSGQNFESTERHAVDVTEEPKRDILNSDFASHWQNLQFGRLCQGPRYPAPLVYPSPTGLPQMYLQGRVPWDGQGRPLSANPNLVSHHLVPVIPLQPDSSAPTTAYQRYADELPRYRSGTGTYLPNHKVSARDRHFGTRRNSYNYDRSDHSDREGNWNTAKSRAAGRSHNRRQADKSRFDRLSTNGNWAYRHQPLPYQSQNGPLRPSSSHGSSASVAYGMYPITQNGPNMQSVVMLYPYDNNDQPEFSSVGPVGYVGSNDASQLYEDQRYHRSSAQQSSPDQPSSPRFHRRF